MSLAEAIVDCADNYNVKSKTFKDPKAKSISTYRVENSNAKNYEIIKIDGCVFKSDETKCDYAMRLIEEKKIFFIELKGSDNNKGLEQLYQTIINTKKYFSSYKNQVRLIVSKAEAPRNLNQNLIAKIATLTGDVMNGKLKKFIKINNTYTEII
ncbi:MAG TPA: hypothetical protein PLW32_05985 [Chitinophagaceae bacterium]|jgi:hypothetical protein|nr:hypothetical protein [Chitinophagaceae bacterium]